MQVLRPLLGRVSLTSMSAPFPASRLWCSPLLGPCSAYATKAKRPATKKAAKTPTNTHRVKRTTPKLSPPAPLPRPRSANAQVVVLKKRKQKKANTNTMAAAAKAYTRQLTKKGPRSLRDEVLAEMHLETEGPTIQVTKDELEADPTTLSFEQLYRRILRTFEEHRLPERSLLFEMLKRSKSPEEWNNFVIIAKVYQSKLLVLKPHQASHLIHLAVKQGFLDQIYDEIHKNVLFVYPTKMGYQKLIAELMKAGQLDKIWKTLQLMAERDIQPSRETFKDLIRQYQDTDLDTALRLFKASTGLGVRTTSVQAHKLTQKLAEMERWDDILELEKIARKDNPQHPFRQMTSLLFIKAHLATGDEEGAAHLIKANYTALQEDITTLGEAKNLFAFIPELVDNTIPQLAGR